MTAGVRVTGLRELEVELSAAAVKVLPETMKVFGQGALNIKKDWQKTWRALRHKGSHIKGLPNAISYDVFPLPGAVRAEIGPDLYRRQGWIGHEIEFGSPTSAPHPGGAPAADAEEPRLEAAMLALTVKLMP